METYDVWLADFRRRLAQRDAGVQALVTDIASRTAWIVRVSGVGGAFGAAGALGHAPDVVCDRRDEGASLYFGVELPETLVRRESVARLRSMVGGGFETRVVLVAPSDDHERQIAHARRMLSRAGLPLCVAAIAPEESTITGADW